MSQTTILITGANRGLGLGLLTRYLSLPNHTLIACVRSPTHPTSLSLPLLPHGPNSTLILLKLDASVPDDASAAIDQLREIHGIEHLDIVIAAAGICTSCPRIAEVEMEELRGHMDVNFYAVVKLYHAAREMLRASRREGGPMFVPLGSSAGCLANQPALPNGLYGPSKAALNWLTIRINAEDEWLNAWVMVPGWVKTDMGIAGAAMLGLDEESRETMMIGIDESCDGMVRVLGEVTKETHGGKMVSYRGRVMGW
ncbi:hypothetical protein BKA64DRAFT_708666 [Cadophora sp. MPI-SDFR-AT-0126]|nr:hypothetical protein BKA64DRAFT_708666 [Leotiomycetes sp. MPI-SDFR-AT-0126]